METERATSSPLYLEPLRSLPVVLVSLFVVVAGVDVLIALAPGLMVSLREYWATPTAGGSTSSALAAAATIVGGVALAAIALATFIRGARSAPYLCLTPIWVCACMLAIARVQTPLPLPVPTSAFVAISALLFVGSGVLFESTSRYSNLIGTATSLLPLTLLSIGYAFNTSAQASFGGDSLLMLFVLALAAAGAPAIAIACRANGAKVLGGPASSADMAAQIAELLERTRDSEERAARAEHQLLAVSGMPLQAAPRLALGDDEHALLKTQGPSGLLGWMFASIAGVAIGAGYVLAYAPLKGELETVQQASAKQAQDSAAKVATLRSDFERKQRDLEQQLAAAATPAQPDAPPPTNAPAPKGGSSIALARESNSTDDADSASDSSEARRQARIAKREQVLAEREQRAAEREQRAAEREANREAAKQAREQERAEREAEHDKSRDERAAEHDKSRDERAAEHEQKVAERKARAAEKAEARAAEREQKVADRAKAREDRAAEHAQRASEKAEDKVDEKPERGAAAAATAALEAEEYGSRTSAKPSKTEKLEKVEKPAAKPSKSEADVEDDSSDDPLEGL